MVAEGVTGIDCIDENIRMMVGEDFSEFIQRVPGAFYFVGCGNWDNTCYPHHHPNFNIDENALPIGVEMHIRLALNYLV